MTHVLPEKELAASGRGRVLRAHRVNLGMQSAHIETGPASLHNPSPSIP
jgi:hypothetical protein